MGCQVIKQPDGKLMIFDSTSDIIVYWDATPDEVVQWFADDAATRARVAVQRIVTDVLAGQEGHHYGRLAMTFDEAIKDDSEHGGDAWNALQDQYDPAVLRA